MVWYRFVSEQIIRSFSPRSVRSTRRNPTLFASPWSSMACVRRLFWLKHWWQMMVALPFQCLHVFFQTCSFPGNWRKRWVALSIEVRLNVPHPFLQAGVEGLVADSECKNMCMFDLLKLYQECWWCRQKHTIFILHPNLSSTKMFQPLLDPFDFEVSTLMRLLNDSFRTPVAFRSRSMVKKNVQSWD